MVATRLSIKDSLEYIKTVRDEFQDNPEIYDSFLKVMKDFKTKRIGRCCVRSNVIELFEGHPELILSFNKFLPECYKITLESDQIPLPVPNYRDAASFIDKVKARLQDDRAFNSFTEILHMQYVNKKSVTEVFHEVFNIILRDHHDLRVEFAYFLPRDIEGWKCV